MCRGCGNDDVLPIRSHICRRPWGDDALCASGRSCSGRVQAGGRARVAVFAGRLVAWVFPGLRWWWELAHAAGDCRCGRDRAHASIVRFRSHRSMNAPAGRYSSKNGSVWANPTTPALAGECVTASTSSGNAIEVTRVPTVDTTWLLHSTTKSRLRRSGTGPAAGGLVAEPAVDWRAPPAMYSGCREMVRRLRWCRPARPCQPGRSRSARGAAAGPRPLSRPWRPGRRQGRWRTRPGWSG